MDTKKVMTKTDVNYSLEKALKIIILLGQSEEELGTTELGKLTKFPLSTIARIVKTLNKWQFVEQNPVTKKFILGPMIQKLMPLGFERNIILKNIAHPVLIELRDKTNETSHLYIRYGMYRENFDNVESRQELKTSGHVGDRSPLHAGAASRVLWAFDSDEDINNLLNSLDLDMLTDKTVINRQLLLDKADSIRRQGYAVSYGERVYSICSISAPVVNVHGRVIAAVGISAPSVRFSKEYEARLVPEVIWASKEISQRLLRVNQS